MPTILQKVAQFRQEIQQPKGYYDRTFFPYDVNVKMHGNAPSLEDVLKLLILPETAITAVRAEFTETQLGHLWDEWIEEERNYLLNDWICGQTHSQPEYWESVRKKVLAGQATNFPAIDHLRSPGRKLAVIQRYARADSKAIAAFDDVQDAQFAGRSGGHFVFRARLDLLDESNELISDLENKAINATEAKKRLRDLQQIHHHCCWVRDQVQTMHRRLDFGYQLQSAITTFLEHNSFDYTWLSQCIEEQQDLEVTIEDSIQAGNCRQGTLNWLKTHFPGRTKALIREVLKISDASFAARNACAQAVRRFLAQATPAAT